MHRPGESGEYSLQPPRGAQTGGMLADLERAARAAPGDVRVWNAMLAELRDGRVTDSDVGAGATVCGTPVFVAVVTPYCREDLAVLRRCHQSVLAQTYPCRHVMVADGMPRDEIDDWNVEHIRLDRTHADYGDTPRAVGGERAVAMGCDAIAYLDADNSLRPHHVASMIVANRATGADVVFAGRTLHFPDGRILPELDPEDCAGHIDTSCLCLAGDARAMASAWLLYPRPLALIDDRLVVQTLRARGLAFACTGALTVRYTINYAWLYEALGLAVPGDARAEFDVTPIADYCKGLSAGEWQALDAALGFPAAVFLRNFVRRFGIAIDGPG